MEPTQSGTDRTQQSPSSSGNWIFPALLAMVLLVLIGFVVLFPPVLDSPTSQQPTSWTPSAEATADTVGMTINFGNGASKVFASLPWQPKLTVAELMRVAHEFRPGIDFTQKGSGVGGFLTSLDGLANEGAGGRNWIYQVDGQHATESFCLRKIEPGMHILWTFTDELYNDEPAEE